MRRLLLLLAFLMLLPGFGARAQHNPVVLELFTSQGCSSCPPADRLLSRLGGQPGIIALALHVDYWDYLGWKDSFGSRKYTKRQRAYARAARKRSVYTPQLIIQGEDRTVGHDADFIVSRIKAHQTRRPKVRLDVDRGNGALTVEIKPLEPGIGAADVHLVRLIPSYGVAIQAGENAGLEINYTDIVTDWGTVARWDGRSDVRLSLEDAAAGPVVVIVQRERMGSILTAAKLP